MIDSSKIVDVMNVEYKWDSSNCKYHRASHLQTLLSRSNMLRYSDGICWYQRWVAAARASLSALTSLRRLKPIIRAAVPCSEPPSAQFLCTYYLAPHNPHFSFGWLLMLHRRVSVQMNDRPIPGILSAGFNEMLDGTLSWLRKIRLYGWINLLLLPSLFLVIIWILIFNWLPRLYWLLKIIKNY